MKRGCKSQSPGCSLPVYLIILFNYSSGPTWVTFWSLTCFPGAPDWRVSNSNKVISIKVLMDHMLMHVFDTFVAVNYLRGKYEHVVP